jgi:hypothetical protein
MTRIVIASAMLAALLAVQPTQAQQPGGDAPRLEAAPEQMAGQANVLEGLPVYASDGEKVGVVKSVEKGPDGAAVTLQAEIDGFLGLGTSSVRFTPDQFQQAKDRVVLTQTADEVRGVPSPTHESFDRGG